MIKVSMVPQVIFCSSKAVPVSNSKKKVGQVLKLLHSLLFYASFHCTARLALLSYTRHKECEILGYANHRGKS